jgi:hypothetical protein
MEQDFITYITAKVVNKSYIFYGTGDNGHP